MPAKFFVVIVDTAIHLTVSECCNRALRLYFSF